MEIIVSASSTVKSSLIRTDRLPMMRAMGAIISIVLAIVSIRLARVLAGRTAAITVTGISTMVTALVLPPSFSLHVDSSADAAALVVQGVLGLAIASGITSKKRQETHIELRHKERNHARRQDSLSEVAQRVMHRDPALHERLSDLEVFGELESHVPLSTQDLERILCDLLRVSFSLNDVERVSIHTGRQPSSARITVVASYKLSRALPHVYSLGQSDNQCVPFEIEGWQPNCSVRWFDNGYAYVYQVSITPAI